MLRDIFSSASRVSEGGIILPANKVVINIDLARMQRIAGKIARGVLFLATQKYFPKRDIADMRICENPSEIPELYQLCLGAAPMEGTYSEVFSHSYFPYNGYHHISLFFWKAFMFCVTIQDNEE